LILLVVACVAIGCAAPIRAPIVPPGGLLFASVRAPLMSDFEGTRLGTKHGRASALFVQDPILTGISLSWGDASMAEAAREGEITEISHADYEELRILGVFVRFTTHAYGE
jgi:hypothetical protein